MDDLNKAHVLRQLWEKLPWHLRSKWRKRNNKTKSAKGRIADFEEFSQFVREQAVKFRRMSRGSGKGTSLATGLKQEGRAKQSLLCSLIYARNLTT